MMKSVRSLIKTMTPTSRRQKEQQGTPDTAAESPEPPPPMDIPQLYRLLDTQIRVNIGTSVKCGICLSTLQTPTRTPCGHAFCKPCILASLRATSKCPECNTKITKRALQPAHEQLQKLAMLYKQSLVEFGFAPGIYQAGFTTLTQKPPADPDESEEDSDDDNDQPGAEKDRGDSDKDKKQLALDRLHVAATWHHHAVPTTKIQKDENALVVHANTKACETAGWVVGQPPTTQDIWDQAREQQVADTALEESFQDLSTPPRSTGHRRVSFEPVSSGRKRPIPKPSSTTDSPFLAPSLSPIAREGSQRSETEPTEDCKPAAVAFCVDQQAEAVVASCRSPSTKNEAEPPTKKNEAEPATKVAATSKPSNEPTQNIESKFESKEPTLTTTKVATATCKLSNEPTKNIESRSEGKEPTSTATKVAAATCKPSNEATNNVESKSKGKEPTSTAICKPSKNEPAKRTTSKSEGKEPTSTATEVAAATCKPSNEPAKCITSKSEGKEPTSTATEVAAATCKPSNEPAKRITSKSEGKEPTSTTGSFKSILESHSEGKEPIAASTGSPTEKIQASPKAEVSGVVEDSFGALHWTNKSNISLTLSSLDEPEYSTLSQTLHHEEPPSNHCHQNMEDIQEKMEPERTKLDPSTLEEDSDTTVPMSSDTISSAIEQEDDNKKPSAATSFRRRRANSEPSFAIHVAFAVGDIVNVQSRTWSGINKPGGVARITKINPDNTYNVAYVLGGKESNVDSVFVTATENTDKRRRRETTLPVYLLQALEAQGFDTTGQLTLEHAPALPKKEKADSSNRKPNPKDAVQDLSSQPTGSKSKRQRRENTLPASLLRELEAQGFDTKGKLTLKQASMVPKQQEKDRSSSRKPNRKGALQDLSNQPMDSKGKRRRGEVTPPVSLQEQQVHGVDTPGQLASEQAAIGPKQEKKDSSSRKPNRKDTIQDLSDQAGDSKGEEEDVKPPAKKAKVSTGSYRRERKSTSSATTEELPAGKPTKKRNRQTVNPAQSVTDVLGCKKQSSKRNKTGDEKSDTPKIEDVQATSTEERCPRMSTAVSVLETLKESGTLSNDEVCKVADAHYQVRFEASLQEKVIHVVASGLSEVDIDILKALTSKSLANDVRIKLGDRITKKTALCITPLEVDVSTGDSTTLLRTVKVMRASLAGIPIVTPTWLYECEQEVMAVSLSPRLLARSLPTKADPASFCGDSKHGVARMAALLAKKSPLPLHNHFIFFCGAFEGSHRKDLQLLAREAGAKVLTNASDVTKKLGKAKVVLVCHDVPTTGTMIPPSLLEAVRTSLTSHSKTTMVVNSQWIFESVTCAKAIPSNAFAPMNGKARELWQLGQES